MDAKGWFVVFAIVGIIAVLVIGIFWYLLDLVHTKLGWEIMVASIIVLGASLAIFFKPGKQKTFESK
ncbi:MAG: hypothetical protein WCO55_04270 [Candidatus Falkowbacteria bacterium]